MRVVPQEPTNLGRCPILLMLIDLNNAVSEVTVISLGQSMDLEFVAVELLTFVRTDIGSEISDFFEGEL